MPSTSTVLTGLSLVTGIAREATDSVPIVKQILGVASRIVGLAEQIDKNRDDLHALADRAKKMELTLAAVVGDREPEDRLLRSLDDMNSVLRAVENHFDKHLKRGRVRKTLRYVFTVRKEIDRLRGEFDDRLRELEVAASLNASMSATSNARFNGEFRNIRHSEIDLLRRITPSDNGWRGYRVNCHLATCEGSNQVVVVREIVQCGHDEEARQRIEEHDSILERMSLVQNRHPNIAYLYGKNSGPVANRFVVLKAGDIRPLDEVLVKPCTTDVSLMGRIIAKLVDAVCHLQKHGATLSFISYINIYLDKNYEPKIGIQDDLHTLYDSPEYHTYKIEQEMKVMLGRYSAPLDSQENEFPWAHFQTTTWLTELFGTLIEAGYHAYRKETVFRWVDIPSLIPLSRESQMYLRQSNSRRTDELPCWYITLLDLAIGGRNDEGSFLHAQYCGPTWTGEDEYMGVYCVEYTVDVVYHNTIEFFFPSSASNEIKEQLGIPASADDQEGSDRCFYLQRFAGTCTGWRRGFPSKNVPR